MFPGPWALRSQRVVRPDAPVGPATVLIEDGCIRDVLAGDGLALSRNLPVVDVGDSAVSPGLVDSHVHVNEPGRTD